MENQPVFSFLIPTVASWEMPPDTVFPTKVTLLSEWLYIPVDHSVAVPPSMILFLTLTMQPEVRLIPWVWFPSPPLIVLSWMYAWVSRHNIPFVLPEMPPWMVLFEIVGLELSSMKIPMVLPEDSPPIIVLYSTIGDEFSIISRAKETPLTAPYPPMIMLLLTRGEARWMSRALELVMDVLSTPWMVNPSMTVASVRPS